MRPRPALIAVLLLGGADVASASCREQDIPSRVRADLVTATFHGRVVAIDAAPPDKAVQFVTGAWWGPGTPARHVTILTNESVSALAGVKIGAELVIYAIRTPTGELRVGECGGSTSDVLVETALLGTPDFDYTLPQRAMSPAETAIRNGDAEALQWALAGGADPREDTPDGPLANLAMARCDLELVAQLAAWGAPSSMSVGFAQCPESQWVALLQAQQVDRGDDSLGNAIANAVYHGHLDWARAMLEAGGNPNVRQKHWIAETPLGYALLAGDVEAWRLLASHGAKLDRYTLAAAADSPLEEARRLVLDADLEPELASFILQRKPTRPDVVRHLLAQGANPQGVLKRPRGIRNPLDEAVERRAWDVAEILIAAGAVPHQGTLKEAAEQNALAFVQVVLAAGIRPDADTIRVTRRFELADVRRALLAVGEDDGAR